MALKTATSGRVAAFSELVPIATAAITTIAMLGWLMWRCNFGFDLTDEGFYLNWISNPFIYPASVFQFGFVYHPLYQLVDGDVAQLRQSNIIITFGLAWALCLILLRPVFRNQDNNPDSAGCVPRWLAASAALASTSMASLVFSGYWLPTPSYNTLAFNALLIAGIGVLLAGELNSRAGVAGWVLIGFAGWLAFMAKPTTALALGSVILIYLLIAGRFNLRRLAISAATAVMLLACSAWAIDGSIMLFIKRLGDASEHVAILGGKHTFGETLRWDSFELNRREIVEFWLATLIVFIAAITSAAQRKAIRMVNAGLILMMGAVILALIFEMYFPALSRTRFHGLLVWAAVAGALLAVAILFKREAFEALSRRDWGLISFFLVLPHAYAFGTGNNYWASASSAGFFWIASGVALLCALRTIQVRSHIVLQVAIGAQAIVIALLYIGMENPYRQSQPLRMNANVAEMGGDGATLLLNEELATYLSGLRQAAAEAGLEPGTPVIDLTGHSPGSLYALRAQAIGQAWMIGGYPGSERLAQLSLDSVPCSELAVSWLLAEPSGTRKLSESMLERYGIRFNIDYGEVARIHVPEVGMATSQEHILYRPLRTSRETEVECQRMRSRI